MVYIYSLPSENLQYPDVRNVLLKTYLKNNKIKNKYVDYVTYLINDILLKDSKLSKAIENIKNNDMLLTDANVQFLNSFNNYLKKYNLRFDRKFIFNSQINSLADLLKVGNEIKGFTDLFPVEYYQDNDIIYFGVHFGYQLPFALNLAKRIKKINKKTKIVLGGNYLTQLLDFSNEIINKSNDIDSIILFGHCITFLNLIKYYHNKDYSLDNILIKDSDSFIINKNIKDDVNCYQLDYTDIDLSKYLSRKRIMPIILNYGCYHHKCTFCAHYFYYGNYMRLNTKNICRMIMNEYKKSSFDVILFLDECIPSKQLFEFANFIISKNIKTTWMIETRISKDYLDKDKIKLLYDSGLRLVSFGIESYNQRILNKMNKKIEKKDIKKILSNFYNNNIIVSTTFMIGYPGEKLFEIFNTLLFISRCKYIDLFGLNPFQLVRNSIIANKNNIVFDDINTVYIFNNKILYIIIHKFKNKKLFRKNKDIQSKLLNRADYLFIDRKHFSINYKENNYEKEC